MAHRLFVYGTLLPGLCRHDAMQGARWLGGGAIEAALYDLGPYPAVVQGVGRVRGQVAEVDDALLARLDAIEECHPQSPECSEYLRERFPVRLDDGSMLEAWVYRFNRSVARARHVRHGDYLRHLRDTGYTPTLDVHPRAG